MCRSFASALPRPVRPTPGISCERPICSTLVCFIPLFCGPAQPCEGLLEKGVERHGQWGGLPKTLKAEDLFMIDPHNWRVSPLAPSEVERTRIVTPAGHAAKDEV